MSNKTYVVYKEPERKFWVFETVENGIPVHHYFTSKHKAIMAVLRLNPGVSPIILSFQKPEGADENKVGE